MTFRRLVKYWLYGSCPGFAGAFPYLGTRVHFPKGCLLFRLACERGIFEEEIVRLITALVEPDTTMFDVGANIGLMAIPALETCCSSRVVSFEPSPSSVPYLKKTIAGSAYRDRWTLRETALGAKNGELEFWVGDPANAGFEGFRSESRLTDARKIKVAVSTVDEEWEKLAKPRVSLVKIDVEGAEQGVLDGAARVLGGCHPCVITEWHAPYLRGFGTRPSYLFDLAKQFDYHLFGVSNGVSIGDLAALRVQMVYNANFVLVPNHLQTTLGE
jgi:FkbM family methyltransferase